MRFETALDETVPGAFFSGSDTDLALIRVSEPPRQDIFLWHLLHQTRGPHWEVYHANTHIMGVTVSWDSVDTDKETNVSGPREGIACTEWISGCIFIVT
jgi:hypothetical protein